MIEPTLAGTAADPLARLLVAGGRERVALLRYCAISATMEPMALFAIGEYRLKPTNDAAIAIYEMFCAQGAPGRIGTVAVLPPLELRLGADIARLAPADSGPAMASGAPRHLFDRIAGHVMSHSDYIALGHRFDASIEPEQNLPGGAMTARQRQFRDRVWLPVIRPRLAAAGFWQLTSID